MQRLSEAIRHCRGLSCEELSWRAVPCGHVRSGERKLVQRSGPTGQREACVAGADLGGISKTEVRKPQSLVGDGVLKEGQWDLLRVTCGV